MPTERRRIIFTNDEVVDAALCHCRNAGIPLPDADVERGSSVTGGDCSIVLKFAVSSPELTDEVDLDPSGMLAALIEFCRLQTIPLPKAAAKRLEHHDGAVSMVFEMKRPRGSVSSTLAA